MVGSPEVNKIIRKIISPALRQYGFTKVKARNYWLYRENEIWYIVIKSVGSYFSQVTGFPSQSVSVSYGIYFTNMPSLATPKIDKDGLAVPKEYECQFRGSIENIVCQKHLRKDFGSEPERNRKNIWWISNDGSNIDDAIEDIKNSLMANAIPDMESASKNLFIDN